MIKRKSLYRGRYASGSRSGNGRCEWFHILRVSVFVHRQCRFHTLASERFHTLRVSGFMLLVPDSLMSVSFNASLFIFSLTYSQGSKTWNDLSDHRKSGQRLSLQNRPKEGPRTYIVLPCRFLLRQVSRSRLVLTVIILQIIICRLDGKRFPLRASDRSARAAACRQSA